MAKRAPTRRAALSIIAGALGNFTWGAHVAAAGVALIAATGLAQGEALLVGAAASLREPALEIAGRFADAGTTRVDVTFGASSVLAAQIRAGAPIDVLLCADERIVDRLEREGLVAARVPLGRNRLVVMAAAGSHLRLESAADLAREELRRLAVPAYSVPVGRYAREWLAARGLLEALAPRMVETEHARATLAAVELGHVDAAIVYATDARVARSARVAFSVPPDEHSPIYYVAAAIRGSRHAGSSAGFLRFLEGDAARASLRAAGFDPPADPPAADRAARAPSAAP